MTTRNHRIRFCDSNAADGASVTAASALAGFPVSNLTNTFRFKLWKPAGAFEITTANNKLYINDDSDKTITLTAATYTYATLAAHIQTQLNASSSDWTCTYSTSTGKFTIARSSGTAILRFSQTTAAVWDSIGYTGAIDDATGPFPADEQRNHTSEKVTIDLGTPQEITFFSLIGPLGEPFSVSSVGTITLKANSVNDFTAPPLSVSVSRTDRGAMRFLDDLADTTYRYWQIEITDRLNTAGPEGFSFAHLYLGDYVTIERRNLASGYQLTHVDPSTRHESESGSLFFGARTKYHRIDSVDLRFLEASDRREIQALFDRVGLVTPFYVSLDPTLGVSTSLPELTWYVVFDKEPSFNHVKASVFTVGMSFREVI